MQSQPTDNADQAEYWNSEAGKKWVDHQEALDAAMAPALDALLARAALQPGEAVLDIGCGTGASCLAAARAVGPEGRVLGVDIAAQLLEMASARVGAEGLGNLDFRCADAATHAFDPSAFDAMISRFGVMFFADPAAAFGNVARALRPGGRIAALAWASIDRNPWFAIGAQAAVRRLGTPPPSDPDAPGPMAFQNAGRVVGLLRQAGLADVAAEPVESVLTPQGTARDIGRFLTVVGPAARLLRVMEGTEEDTAAIAEEVARGVARYATAQGIRVPATYLLFTARRP